MEGEAKLKDFRRTASKEALTKQRKINYLTQFSPCNKKRRNKLTK